MINENSIRIYIIYNLGHYKIKKMQLWRKQLRVIRHEYIKNLSVFPSQNVHASHCVSIAVTQIFLAGYNTVKSLTKVLSNPIWETLSTDFQTMWLGVKHCRVKGLKQLSMCGIFSVDLSISNWKKDRVRLLKIKTLALKA